jgi:hypothetical protein
MRPCALLFTVLCLPAFSQQLVGIVQSVDKDQFQVKGQKGLVTFRADENTIVAKIKKSNDLSVLAVGDEVRINYYGQDKLTAVNICAKVTVSGTIRQTASNHITISTDDSATADRGSGVFVFLSSPTRLGVGREELKVGRKVHVTGWDSGDGVVEAEKVVLN